MNVLLVGGSGHVGSFITPYMMDKHHIRVLDLKPPVHDGVEYLEGSIADPEAVDKALDGMDTFINLVMRNPNVVAGHAIRQHHGEDRSEAALEDILNNYQVNVVGLHLLLNSAKNKGVKNGVHTSTTTVHDRPRHMRYASEEEVPLYNPSLYGFTKGLGELVCRYFCREFDMNIIALRITGPRTRQQWIEEYPHPQEINGRGHLFPADEEDLANAYLAALESVKVGQGRFDAIYIAGDVEQREINLTKAKRILGWEPQTHLKVKF